MVDPTNSEVVVRVPAGNAYQLVYRLERREPFSPETPPDAEYFSCRSLASYLRHRSAILRLVGAKELAKGIVRILRGRVFYGVRSGGRFLHTGWATVSVCRHYRVGRGDVVIGPIWSSNEARGKGLGTYATMRAIDEFLARGHTRFWIDTSDSNISCLRLIAKCGFAEPAAIYWR